MRKDEVIIKIATEIDMMCGNLVDLQSVRLMLERVLYDYDVNTKETALTGSTTKFKLLKIST